MKRSLKIPFKGLSSEAWLNLLLLALVTIFVINFLFPLIQGEWCKAIDFCGYYSAGRVMNEGKGLDIYNQEILEKKQVELFSSLNMSEKDAEFIPIVYLPVFLLPFRLFALFDFPVSLLLWYLLNFSALALYLSYFSKKVSEDKPNLKVFILLFISYPVLQNFMYGQINVWLLICIAEFIRAVVSEKPYKAGLWLGGWLVKPQLLVLILVFLLVQKKYKVILGFFLSSAALLIVSWLLVGGEGIRDFINLIFESVEGGAASHFEYMMNWRMLSFYVSYFTSPTVGWIFLGLTSTVTAGAPLLAFRKKLQVISPQFAIALLGILAATTAVSYHAHLHTAMILIPILLYLYMKGYMKLRPVLIWVAIPYGVNLALYVLSTLILANVLPIKLGSIIEIVFGIGLLIVNLFLLGWSISNRRFEDESLKLEPVS